MRAVERIAEIRDACSQPSSKRRRTWQTVRTFELPRPAYGAPDFSTMINWEVEQVTEPPYLRKFSMQQIRQFIVTPLVLDVPSNTQFVERAIKLVTSNGTRAATAKLRDGLCRATVESRKRHPHIETMKDFSV